MGAACRPAHREMLKLRLDAIRAQMALVYLETDDK
jgi:hypothetical protein